MPTHFTDEAARSVLLSGDATLDTEGTTRWKDQNVRKNDGAEAFLRDDAGEIVSRRRCSS